MKAVEADVKIDVYDNNVEQAMKRLKKILNREGVFREMKQRRFHEKPFEKRQRKKREAERRMRKSENRRAYR